MDVRERRWRLVLAFVSKFVTCELVQYWLDGCYLLSQLSRGGQKGAAHWDLCTLCQCAFCLSKRVGKLPTPYTHQHRLFLVTKTFVIACWQPLPPLYITERYSTLMVFQLEKAVGNTIGKYHNIIWIPYLNTIILFEYTVTIIQNIQILVLELNTWPHKFIL